MVELEPTREATILDLTEKLGSQLTQLKLNLNSRFCRVEPEREEKKSLDRPMQTNVLDEITDKLTHHIIFTDELLQYVLNDILPKISK